MCLSFSSLALPDILWSMSNRRKSTSDPNYSLEGFFPLLPNPHTTTPLQRHQTTSNALPPSQTSLSLPTDSTLQASSSSLLCFIFLCIPACQRTHISFCRSLQHPLLQLTHSFQTSYENLCTNLPLLEARTFHLFV